MASASITPLNPASASAFKRRGLMLVLSSPPGGGKTTISRELVKLDSMTTVSVSATTRDKRPGEVEGEHYYFVTKEKFKQMTDAGEMLEVALVYNDKYYGTPKKPVEKALAEGRDVIFDVDWQGNRSFVQKMPDDVVSIFLLPPSWEVLEERLRGRARDSEEEIVRRLSKAADEISHYNEFQYVIVNHDLKESIAKVRAILEAERNKRQRLGGIQEFVDTLKS